MGAANAGCIFAVTGDYARTRVDLFGDILRGGAFQESNFVRKASGSDPFTHFLHFGRHWLGKTEIAK